MELLRALAVFAEPTNEKLSALAETLGFEHLPTEDEFTEIFIFQLVPFASVYLGEEGMLGGVARDRIAGFWRALNLTPPNEPDHLSTILGLYSNLYERSVVSNKENKNPKSKIQNPKSNKWSHARKVFFWEHIASWLPLYLHKMKSIASPFYLRWCELLEEILIEEANSLGQPETISQHLIQDASIQDPREFGFEMFLSMLLAPVRSGMILTRDDLQRAAKELNLGLRIGERKFILKALFSQDANKMLKWLSIESEEWLQWHKSQQEIYGETAVVWAKKAESTLLVLNELETNL